MTALLNQIAAGLRALHGPYPTALTRADVPFRSNALPDQAAP
ncbi:hypothetical protein [Nocardia carnea]|uniref:Uncharacterized protein n=1 Tax=Nocardia carnea TaxID=37328 RepID=A0ABW7TWN2_9NOCA|nr:hypothetical protein [Nocardia carnea]